MGIFTDQLEIVKKKSETKNLSANEQAILQADDMLKNMAARLAEAELQPLEGYRSQIESDIELRIFSGERHGDLKNISRMELFSFGGITQEKIDHSVTIAQAIAEAIDADSELDEYRHVQLVINWQYVNI